MPPPPTRRSSSSSPSASPWTSSLSSPPFRRKLLKRLNDKKVVDTLSICKEMFDDAVDHLNTSLDSLRRPSAAGEKLLTTLKIEDLKTWLSAVLTDQETCLDAFEGVARGFREQMASAMRNSTRFTSNNLAIVSGILGLLYQFNIPIHRKLLSTRPVVGVPAWVRGTHRRALLQAGSGVRLPSNVTVAQDGTGQVRTIGEAVAMVPKKSPTPFVIHIKEGKYKENVVLDKNKWRGMP